MWFEDSCHVEDLFFQFSSGFIFSFNSEPSENLIQIETEFFTPRNWQKLFFADFFTAAESSLSNWLAHKNIYKKYFFNVVIWPQYY